MATALSLLLIIWSASPWSASLFHLRSQTALASYGERAEAPSARRPAGHPRRRARIAAHRYAAQDRRQLLAVRDDAVGLHPARDAVRSSRHAHQRRDLRRCGILALHERHRRRARRRGSDDVTADQD